MSFDVSPKSQPPTNVHVLIGRNGVGKTRAMRGLVKALLGRIDDLNDSGGLVEFRTEQDDEAAFSSLVLISFSAFDDFYVTQVETDRIPIQQVSLRTQITVDGVPRGGIKAPRDLAVDFRSSLERCQSGLRKGRWLEAVHVLESDDLFAEVEVAALLQQASDESWAEKVEHRFHAQPTSEAEQTFHPYFDNCDDGTWLRATLVQTSPPSLVFHIASPQGWSQAKIDRVRHHFAIFKLGPLYSSHAGEQLTNLRFSFDILLASSGPDAVKSFLANLAEGARSANANGWKTAMYEALVSEHWFWNGGFAA